MARWLILVVFLTGCASGTIHRDPTGTVWKVSTKGNMAMEYTKGEETVKADSKYDLLKGIVQVFKA